MINASISVHTQQYSTMTDAVFVASFSHEKHFGTIFLCIDSVASACRTRQHRMRWELYFAKAGLYGDMYGEGEPPRLSKSIDH